jgi:hypothetical protein
VGGRHPPPRDDDTYFFFFLAAFFFFAIEVVTSFRPGMIRYRRLPFLVAFFFLPPFLTAFLRFGM